MTDEVLVPSGTVRERLSVKERLARIRALELVAAEPGSLFGSDEELLRAAVEALARHLDIVLADYRHVWLLYADAERRAGAPQRAVRAKRLERVAKARALRVQGLSVSQIALRMSLDEGRAAVFPKRTVERWLAAKTPTD